MAFASSALRVVLLLLVLGAASPGVRADEQPLVLGQIRVSFYTVTAALVQEVLERLGHAVTVREGTHEEMFPLLGRGELDLFAVAWLPHAHGAYWERYGREALELATLYERARLFWAVPAYVPEPDVAAIADLAKPEVARRMTKTLQGISPGAGSSIRSLEALEAYGLRPLGYTYRFGTWQERWQALHRAVQEGEWIVVPMGAPMFLNHAYAVRPLDDPKGVLGGEDRGVLLAHRSLPARVPARTLETLRRIRIGIEGVSELDDQVVRRGLTPREAARGWMAGHPAEVREWFGAAESPAR